MGAGRTARGQGRRRPLWLVLALSAVAAAALALGGAAGGGGVAADGSVAAVPTNEESQDPAISADGRFVAFDSFASNLVAGDTNGVVDVFVRDRVAGATERVSVSSSGAQANGSVSAAMSADGRFVAFSSDLVAGDTLEDLDDVFVRDRVAGTTKRVSVSSTGAQANDSSKSPAISADGRFVVFGSGASNLVAGDTNGAYDVFVRDRVAGTTERVSLTSTGAQVNHGSNVGAGAISADGRFVVFDSTASNLVAGDTNGAMDVFVRDRVARTTERVSVSSAGAEARAGCKDSGDADHSVTG